MKLFNDPVHGFIEVRSPLLLRVVDHPWMQRLRRIKQMGASSLVYPGAEHTRLNHALGAYYLGTQALSTLQAEGALLADAEVEGTLAAVLLHDIGHGPFSHALEHVLLPGLRHEAMSLALMQRLNSELDGALDLAIRIFTGSYPRRFLHELVSSQLDVDRLDYLLRDSFFTGVAEGVIGVDRILKTLTLVDEQLVVHEKGLHSVEKFLVARRQMYWQVYFHKTAQAAESLLQRILEWARRRLHEGAELAGSPAFLRVLRLEGGAELTEGVLRDFVALDDHDVYGAVKAWADGNDPVLADLCRRWLDRRLFRLRYYEGEVPAELQAAVAARVRALPGMSEEAVPYYVFTGAVSNLTYGGASGGPLRIRRKDGSLAALPDISDLAAWDGLERPRRRSFLCAPAEAWPS